MSAWWLRFLPLARPSRGRIVALTLIAALGVALEALLPWPLKLVIDHVLAPQPLPDTVSWLQQLPGGGGAISLLAWLSGAMLLIFLLLQAQQLARGLLQADVAGRLRLALAARVFAHLQDLSLRYHQGARRGDLLRRVMSDSGCLASLVTEVLLPVLTATLSLVVLFTIMWQLDQALALAALLIAVPMAGLMAWLGPRMSERAYHQQEAEGAMWSLAEQSLTAIPVVQGFGREELEGSRFRGVADRSVRAYLRTLSSQVQFRAGIDASEALGVAAMFAIGGYQVLHGHVSTGTLVVFLSYLTALYAPLLAFAYLAMTVASAAASARRVAQVLDARERVVQAPDAQPLRRDRRGCCIRFESVTVGYEPGSAVLHGVDLEVRAGETLALMGASGAGKSTLVSLVPRLCDPWHGRVLIDGQDLRGLTIDSVRACVAYVPQDPFLLPLRVADTIAYGRPSATAAEIESAARRAGAHAFITRLPQGYDTVIGERGVTLSGGQRQRLSIARALLKDAPVLVMDEPTSALDLQSEQEVLDALDTLTEGRTTIVIAHRLSTVRRATRIALLERGTIVATGTHAQLWADNALYRMLYRSEPAAPARSMPAG